MSSVYIYTAFLFFFVGSLSLINSQYLKYLLLCILIFSIQIIAGLRFFSDADYKNYIEIYDAIPYLSDFSILSVSHIHGEIGFLFFISIVKSIFNHPAFFFIIFTTISFVLKLKFFKASTKEFLLAYCIYLCYFFYQYEFIQIRMGVMIGFVALALLNIKSNKFYIFIFIGSMFQKLALLFVSVKFLIKQKNLTIFIFTVISISTGTFLSFPKIIDFINGGYNSPFYHIIYNYANNPLYSSSVSIFQFIPLRHLLVFLLTSYFIFNNNRNEQYEYIWKVYCIGIILSFPFLSVEIFFTRIISVLDLVEPLLLLMTINIYFSKNKNILKIIYLLFSVLFLVYSVIHSNGIYNYNNWLGLYL
ncbi:EpsG family protein [Photobacterium sp. GB-1]|uniref:EpsG family protein n=1 Tax=Photobacterium sp. GB-1 TaxID=2022111 RepID=UPI00130496C3|nr:EpsG family protein [Photobacterium sp. GB-1]